MMEKLYGIEALKADCPHVFELMADLRRQIDEITGAAALQIDEMRELGASKQTLDEIWHRSNRNVEPMRQQIDAMTKQLAGMLGSYPMAPVVLPRDQINPPAPASEPARHRPPS